MPTLRPSVAAAVAAVCRARPRRVHRAGRRHRRTLGDPVRTDRHRRVDAARGPADVPAGGRRGGHDRARGRPDAGGVRGLRYPRRGARPAERRPGVPVGAASSSGWSRRATSSRRSAGPADGERSFTDAVDVLRGVGATEVAFVGRVEGRHVRRPRSPTSSTRSPSSPSARRRSTTATTRARRRAATPDRSS